MTINVPLEITILVPQTVTVESTHVDIAGNELEVWLNREWETLSDEMKDELIRKGYAGELTRRGQRPHLREGFTVAFYGPSGRT